MATRHPHMSFRDRVTTALFDDIYERDLEFDAKIIAEIERLRAVERRAREFYELCGEVRGGAADYILNGEPTS